MGIEYIKIPNIGLVIKILECACQTPGNKISEKQIHKKLSLDFSIDLIKDAFNSLRKLQREDQTPILSFKSQGQYSLKYINGLEEYVSKIKKKCKKRKAS
jgi:hypothetical protein